MISRLKFNRKAMFFIALLAIVPVILLWRHQVQAPGVQPIGHNSRQTPKAQTKSYPSDQADSLWVVVNKGRQLPASYVPAHQASNGLRYDTSIALNRLLKAAAVDRLPMIIVSGYRSYANQTIVYNGYVKQFGQSQADTFSARPGHSEHQTGLAADLAPADNRCSLDQCFGQTAEGKWLLSNAYKFGFIIRYGRGQEHLTGYEYEPWHIRYVGVTLATKLRISGQTLEQYFRLPVYTSYPRRSLILK